MSIAHMVGEHSYQSWTEQLSHIIFSWAGFAITVVLGIILSVVVYKKMQPRKAKEKVTNK